MAREKKTAAGLFDIRRVIAALLGLYGAVLVGVNLADRASVVAKTGGDADLWAGVGLLLVAGLFAGWAHLRPVSLPGRDADTSPGSENSSIRGG